ncbi:MAG: hypothetical protein ABJF04_21560 [Reichenbachiella sp.]|uniref:hypothetical protein n=1 Tax=Reichenbachiella sp. TaxID=2184521 RepID=UPI0032630554
MIRLIIFFLIIYPNVSSAQSFDKKELIQLLEGINQCDSIDNFTYLNKLSEGTNLFIERDSLSTFFFELESDKISFDLSNREAIFLNEANLFYYDFRNYLRIIRVRTERNEVNIEFKKVSLFHKLSSWTGVIKGKLNNSGLESVEVVFM